MHGKHVVAGQGEHKQVANVRTLCMYVADRGCRAAGTRRQTLDAHVHGGTRAESGRKGRRPVTSVGKTAVPCGGLVVEWNK